MCMYFIKKHYIIYILIGMIAISAQIFLPTNRSNIKSTRCSVYFTSNSKDSSIKELKYIVGLKNQSNQRQNFHLLIERPNEEWYPFLSSIPEEFYTDVLTINSQEVRDYTIKINYKSEDDRVTGGNLDDFKVKVLTENEYQELLEE